MHRCLIVAVLLGAIGFVALAPFAYQWISFRGVQGYYETGAQCGCGYEVFTYIDGTGYFRYTPGHRMLDLKYSLRPSPSGWDAIDGGTNVFRLKVAEGSAFVSGRIGTTNETRWFKLDKVHNAWRILLPRLLPEE